MKTSWLSLVALLVSGCVMNVSPDPGQEETANLNPGDTELRFDRVRHEVGPTDLCETGQLEMLNGVAVRVPVPCTRETIDRGDPPDSLQDPSEMEEKVNPGDLPTSAHEARATHEM